ncbi:hypothetical protein ABEB36_010775 [Hypothenemus hampei]|uniref:MADF domain-containing protein n=1 Tax=Hypothenemus hampei TaxID=57062 RepID=A0ABD1EDN9_HYPHA
MWDHRQIKTLIELYRNNPCLYEYRNSLYRNKHARNKALEEIRTALYKLGLNVSIAEIKSKFNNLRTTFLVQHRKYLSSLKSGSGSDDQKRINIQNIETIRTPNIATRLSRPSSISTDMATPSTSRTHSESSSGKKKKRKKSTDDGNFFMSKASNALTTLTNVLARDDNPKPVEISLPKKTSMRTFSEFVESQLEFLMGDEELLLETQQEILTTIWAARKKKLQK